MDPNLVLINILSSFARIQSFPAQFAESRETETQEALESLENLTEWIRKGGFTPNVVREDASIYSGRFVVNQR